jgi:serine/threonine-protein kinase
MAPEQFDGQPADERSDVYSAAVIVYEVLTGRRPFEGQGAALMKQVLQGEPPLPSSLEPRLSKELDHVLLKALSKRPETRFRSARQFLEALLAAFDGEPLPASVSDTGEQEVTQPSVDETPSGTKRISPTNLSALRRAIATAPPPAPEPQAAPQPRDAARGGTKRRDCSSSTTRSA